jgi:hypothetical protein
VNDSLFEDLLQQHYDQALELERDELHQAFFDAVENVRPLELAARIQALGVAMARRASERREEAA